MYIKEYMRTPVITVAPDTLLDEALRLMHENNIRRLPVVQDGILVGLVTRRILQEATPTSPMPLSIWGAHYQLSKMRIRDVMITDVITTSPDDAIEEVTAMAEKNKIGSLPVVDKQGKLVGILTVTDLNRLLAKILGFGHKGIRLHIRKLGNISHHQIMGVLSRYPVEILSAFSVPLNSSDDEDFIIHLDTEQAEEIAEDLQKLGLQVEMRQH